MIGTPVDVDGTTFLLDKGETIGALLTSGKSGKPVYVSIGHMMLLETAIKIVKHCIKDRIPEPLLQAHELATKERIKFEQENKINITEN